LVNDLVTTLNSDNAVCATFGLYPSYVAGNLNCKKSISMCSAININHGKHIKKCIPGKECTFKLTEEDSFLLRSG
jgi:hypothetical protein